MFLNLASFHRPGEAVILRFFPATSSFSLHLQIVHRPSHAEGVTVVPRPSIFSSLRGLFSVPFRNPHFRNRPSFPSSSLFLLLPSIYPFLVPRFFGYFIPQSAFRIPHSPNRPSFSLMSEV
jgi:hypothetical protein